MLMMYHNYPTWLTYALAMTHSSLQTNIQTCFPYYHPLVRRAPPNHKYIDKSDCCNLTRVKCAIVTKKQGAIHLSGSSERLANDSALSTSICEWWAISFGSPVPMGSYKSIKMRCCLSGRRNGGHSQNRSFPHLIIFLYLMFCVGRRQFRVWRIQRNIDSSREAMAAHFSRCGMRQKFIFNIIGQCSHW